MNIEKLTQIFNEKIKEEDIKFKQLCFYVNDEIHDIEQYQLEIEALLTVYKNLKILYKQGEKGSVLCLANENTNKISYI